jgi:hypothetical protein
MYRDYRNAKDLQNVPPFFRKPCFSYPDLAIAEDLNYRPLLRIRRRMIPESYTVHRPLRLVPTTVPR